ncbi:MAG: hypothetical protein PHV20_04130 [Bacteroidales bacterium]|nr:hypothetical protein [Bacteroidales bacterium]
MTRITHRLLLSFYTIVVLAAIVIIGYWGYSYFNTPIEERFFHPNYAMFKPSGLLGHGLGIVGTLMIIIGLFSYMARKYMRSLSRLGLLKHWLEFHIFMCTLGPVLILYHTSFKFGGIVSVSFWSMVVVWASGVIGRFIYLQIPRSIEGRELSLQELEGMQDEFVLVLKNKYNIDIEAFKDVKSSEISNILKSKNVSSSELKQVKRLIKNQNRLAKRIERLATMQNIFRYWHVAHLPFALIMLIIMVIHVVVTLTLGYKWIF